MCLTLLIRDGLGIPTVKSNHQPVSIKIALPRRQERLAEVDLWRLGLPSGIFLDQPRLAPYSVASGALMPLHSPKANASLTAGISSDPATTEFLKELSELLSREYATTMGANSNLGQGLTVSPAINTFTGNLFVCSLDAAALWRGLNVMVYRVYNGLQRTPGPFGPGWTHNFGARLDFNEDQSIQYTRWDGSRFCYKPDGQGGYSSPEGFDDTLSRTGSGYQLKDESGFFLVFDNTGLLTEIGNPLPFRLRFTYQDGRLLSVRNIRTESYGLTPSGLKLPSGASSPTESNEGPGVTFAYDAEGRITQLRSTTGSQMDYTYNEQGRLARVMSNTQQAVEYRYDGDGRLAEVRRVEPNGMKGVVLFGIVYDERDRVKEVVNESGVTAMRMNYRWAEDRTTEVLLGQQHSVVTDHYDERGVVTERDEVVTNADPSQPASGNGTRQTRECDERLNVTRMDRQDGTNTIWKYDDQGRLVHAQDSNGGFVDMSYNNEYGLVEYLRESTNGRWIRFLYGTTTEGHAKTNGQIEEIQLDDGSRFKLVYDDGGVPRELINATGTTEPLDLGLPPEVPKQLWEF